MTPVSIVGIGTWLPDTIVGNDAWPAGFAEAAAALGDRTFNDIPMSEDPAAAALVMRDLAREAGDPFLGARFRHVADAQTTCADAESAAALAALSEAGIAPADVDLVLANSLVPERVVSLSGARVAHRIGAHHAAAMQLETACASMVSGLEVARAYIESGLAKVVLVVASHLLLRTMPRMHPASPGLGDGAAAWVVARGHGLRIRSTFARTHGDFDLAVTWVRGVDAASDPPWWKPGGEYRLGSRAAQQVKILMRDTVTFGTATLAEAARRAEVDPRALSMLCCVQPRGFIPGAMAEHLGLAREKGVSTYERVAHLGACGPVFNLAQARALGWLEPGRLIGLYAQGMGFTRAAAVLEVC